MRPRPSPGQAPGGAAGGSGLCEQRNSSDTVEKRYYAEGEYYQQTGKKAAYFPDQIGSVRDTVDVAGGALLYGADYTPYGLQTPAWTATGNYFPDVRFAGMFMESNSNEQLTPARLYEAAEGRFMQRDPLGYQPGPNVYAYANGNPIRHVDPKGLYVENTPFQTTTCTAGNPQGQQPYMPLFLPVPAAGGAALLDEGIEALESLESELVTVVHFTDTAGVQAIEASGGVRAGSFVAFPSEINGMTQAEVEDFLGIGPGKGAYSTQFQTPIGNLEIPPNGPYTVPGNAAQFNISTPVRPGSFTPTPTQ